MQQTEKRGFNIIETSDPFSPDALNDNTRKIEAALDAHEEAVKEVTDALDARLQVFEAKKFAYGVAHFPYQGQCTYTELDFTPKILLLQISGGSSYFTFILTDQEPSPYRLQIIENGFTFNNVYAGSYYAGYYNFVAIG